MYMSLFEKNLHTNEPLAQRMRPQTLDEFVGHEKIVGHDTLLRRIIENDELISLIFWAPPGTGKTTLAQVIANTTNSRFVNFSAVTGGVKQLREIVAEAESQLQFHKARTILFVDEIHRFNKSQQDFFLPYVERGVLTLIGATTENPSFEVNAALLSRCKVFKLNQLNAQNIADILIRALQDKERGYGNKKITITKDTIKFLAVMSNGDARTALNTLEFAVKSARLGKNGEFIIDQKDIKEVLQKSLLYDKSGEEHYNIISALHKSLRGSDVNASLYWLGRMLEAGENPLYIVRRLVRFASEDIGMADPRALEQATAAYNACHFIGMPECNVILAQLVVYLGQAPKSNHVYTAYKSVQKAVYDTMNDPVPIHLRNAPTQLMKDLGYGKDYKYNPNYDEPVNQDYLPKKIKGTVFWTGGFQEENKENNSKHKKRNKKNSETIRSD